MLFRPYNEKQVFGFRLPFTPGLIPKRRGVLARKVGKTISEHLLTDETLVNSMLSGQVKKNVEMIADSFFQESKKSEKTLSELISKGAGEADIKANIYERRAELAAWLAQLAESDFFEQNVKPLALNIINQNVKGFASLFVVAENVYGNMQKTLLEYLNNPENHGVIAEKAAEFYGKLAESVKLKDVSSKIDEKYYDSFKAFFMDSYDDFVKSYFPAVFAALDVSTVIEDKINEFEMAEAEEIIISVVDRELKAITYLGGLLGFIIGLVPPVLQRLGIS